MEQIGKKLKTSSVVVLIFAGLSLLQVVCELLFGELGNATVPEGASDNILLITRIFLFSFALLLTLPGVYIGVKGLRVAENPDSSMGHIVWGVILLVITFLCIISPIVAFVNSGFEVDNILDFLSIAAEVIVLFEYVQYAIAVRKTVI